MLRLQDINSTHTAYKTPNLGIDFFFNYTLVVKYGIRHAVISFNTDSELLNDDLFCESITVYPMSSWPLNTVFFRAALVQGSCEHSYLST